MFAKRQAGHFLNHFVLVISLFLLTEMLLKSFIQVDAVANLHLCVVYGEL